MNQFTRLAAGVRQILIRALGVPTANYYDDFPVVVPDVVGDLVLDALEEIERALGWRWKAEKNIPFAQEFKFLGVMCDLSHALDDGVLKLSNTQARVFELDQNMQAIVKAGSLTPAEA